MLSGGFFGDYEWCIGDYCTSWDIVTETVAAPPEAAFEAASDAGRFVIDAYDEAYFSGNGLRNFVSNFSWPFRKLGEAGVEVAKVGFGILGGGCKANDGGAADRIDQRPVEEWEYLSGRNFSAMEDEGIEDYSEQNIGSCSQGLSQEPFDFWCKGIRRGTAYSGDEGECSNWRVYNFDNRQPVCANRIFHVAGFWDWSDFDLATPLDDDYNEIRYLQAAMERLRPPDGKPIAGVFIPGIATPAWDERIVTASGTFVYPGTVFAEQTPVTDPNWEKFLKCFSDALNYDDHMEKLRQAYNTYQLARFFGFDVFANLPVENVQTAEQRIFNCYTELNRTPMTTDWLKQFTPQTIWNVFNGDIWTNLERYSNGDDWIAPLAHAIERYDQVSAFYSFHWLHLASKLDNYIEALGDYEYFVEADAEGKPLIVMYVLDDPANAQTRTMTVREYSNQFIWSQANDPQGEFRSEIIAEINEALHLSERRCGNCIDQHEFAMKVRAAIEFLNGFEGFGLTVPNYEQLLGEAMRRRAARRSPTAESCCHQTPPARLDETTHQCSTQSYYEYCFNRQPPLMFDPDSCECSTAGADLCLNREPRGTYVFVLDPITHQTSCMQCQPPTPRTEDGLRCTGDVAPPVSECGNHRVDRGEECDDGNTTNNDGCRNDCTRPPAPQAVCGNGRVERGEQCDDGNRSNGDGCSSSCRAEAAPPETPVVEVVRNPFSDQ